MLSIVIKISTNNLQQSLTRHVNYNRDENFLTKTQASDVSQVVTWYVNYAGDENLLTEGFCV